MSEPDESRLRALQTAEQRANALASILDEGVEVSTANGWPAALVCAFYGVRTSRALSAIVHLCSNSFGVESQSLLRNMLQDLVDVRYIATDPEALCEQWRTHEGRRRYYTYMTRSDLQEMERPEDFAELEAIIQRDWDEAKAIAAQKARKDVRKVSKNEARKYLLKSRWTRLNIRETAEQANMKYPDTLTLFEWYPYLSEHAHGSPGLASDYLQKHDSQLYIKDHRDPRFKSASMAIAALVYAHGTLVGLKDVGLKYEPDSLLDDLDIAVSDFGDL